MTHDIIVCVHVFLQRILLKWSLSAVLGWGLPMCHGTRWATPWIGLRSITWPTQRKRDILDNLESLIHQTSMRLNGSEARI